MYKQLVLLIILTIPSLASAYDGWSGAKKIESIRIYSNETVLVAMPGTANPGACSSTEYLVLASPETESGKRRYSALLSAYMAGKLVSLALRGCSNGGTSGQPLIEQVWLK